MSKRPSRFLVPALAAAALVAIGGIGVMLASSETMLRSSFAIALDSVAGSIPVRTAAKVPLAGSEDFWLTAMRQDGGAPVSKAISIGDRISMTLDGSDRRLEVTAVNEFTPTKTEIDTRSGGVRLVLVTVSDVSDTARRPIRFVMELEAAQVAQTGARPDRAL